jgi:hypothetical protein
MSRPWLCSHGCAWHVQVPSEQLEKVWEGYERFEHASAGRNNLAAGRFIDEARPRFYAAREAWAARRRLLRPLERDALPWLPGLSPEGSGVRVGEQRAAWLALLEWEAANSQGLDRDAHRRRVDLAFRQALQPLRGCPEARAASPALCPLCCTKRLDLLAARRARTCH